MDGFIQNGVKFGRHINTHKQKYHSRKDIIYSEIEFKCNYDWITDFYEIIVAFQDELVMEVTDNVKPSMYEIRTNLFR